LWQLDAIGLILVHKTGVYYSNQVGGYANFHPGVEGAFVPLKNPEVDQQKTLEEYFTGPKWNGHCSVGIDEETARFVDGVLASSYLTKRLTVNREWMRESKEAWIFVDIRPGEEAEDPDWDEFYGFSGKIGVLTWENSD
jgi:hypothetical protein